jgi:hypothetical protein
MVRDEEGSPEAAGKKSHAKRILARRIAEVEMHEVRRRDAPSDLHEI